VGLVGEDEAGEFIRADCLAHGIDTRQLYSCKDASTSDTDVMTVQSTEAAHVFSSPGGLTRSLKLRTWILRKATPAFAQTLGV
jgi:sugar/nucleoside kinase (ribokinase family)